MFSSSRTFVAAIEFDLKLMSGTCTCRHGHCLQPQRSCWQWHEHSVLCARAGVVHLTSTKWLLAIIYLLLYWDIRLLLLMLMSWRGHFLQTPSIDCLNCKLGHTHCFSFFFLSNYHTLHCSLLCFLWLDCWLYSFDHRNATQTVTRNWPSVLQILIIRQRAGKMAQCCYWSSRLLPNFLFTDYQSLCVCLIANLIYGST